MKKLLALLLCLVMVVSVFAGCNGGGGKDTTGAADDTNKGSQTLPEDITLTIGMKSASRAEDVDLNALTLWLEEATGYDLEIQQYQGTASDIKSKINTSMIAEEKLPDILLGIDLGSGVYQEYGEDGYLMDLAPYFNDEELAGGWWERFGTLPQDYQDYLMTKMYADDGEAMYCFPTIEYTPYDVIASQMFINQDWLETLNLEMPTDLDSLYNVLKAFKTKDPNGNGKQDEVPLIGLTGNYGNVLGWLMNMFLYVDDVRFWNVDDNGELYHIYATDEYREALIFINKLVKEGLLSKSTWSTDSNAIKAMLAPGNNVQTVGCFGGHPTLVGAVDNENFLSYEAMPYWGNVVLSIQANRWDTYITSDCEYPEAAWNLLMTLASREGSFRMRYGEKGVDWVEADPGATSFLGWEAEIKMENEAVWNEIGNSVWGQISATLLIDAENERTQVDENSTEWEQHKYKIMRECYDNYYAAAEKNPTNIVQPLDYTVDEEDEIAIQRSNSTSWVSNCRASFCLGTGDKFNDPNNDAQWAAYVQGIQDAGIEDWKEVAQAVYDDQYGGK